MIDQLSKSKALTTGHVTGCCGRIACDRLGLQRAAALLLGFDSQIRM
jgi:hypothetical protein